MYRTACVAFLLFATSFAHVSAQSINLSEAVQRKKVSIKASAPNGYHQVAMVLKNLTEEPLTVDTFGVLFLPSDGASQRLGVARISVEKAATELTLEAGKETELTAPSFCLDHSRPSPSENAVYALASELVPKGVQMAFEFWNRKPGAGQSLIQGGIWSGEFDKTVALIDKMENDLKKLVTPGLVTAGGTDYVLTPEGKLFAAKPGDKPADRRQILERVCRIFKCDDRLVAVRIEGTATLLAERFENGSWKFLSHPPFLPTHLLRLQDGKLLFADKEWLYLPNRRMVRFKGQVLRLEDSEPARGKECWLLSADKRLFKLDTATGLPVSFDQPYDDMAAGQGLKVYRTGKTLFCAENNNKSPAVTLPFEAEQLQAAGRYVAIVANHELWTLKDGKAAKVAALDGSLYGLDISSADGQAHIYMETGEVKVFPLPKVPPLKLDMPAESPLEEAAPRGE